MRFRWRTLEGGWVLDLLNLAINRWGRRKTASLFITPCERLSGVEGEEEETKK
jgi:hypothetical protein